MNMRKTVSSLTLILCLLLIVSFIIHMPVKVQKTLFSEKILDEPIYTDVINSDYNTIFSSVCTQPYTMGKIWKNKTLASDYCEGRDYYPLPYIHYRFNHAPLAGFTWFVLTYITYVLTPRTSSLHVFRTDIGLSIFYVLYSVYVFVSMILAYLYLNRVFKILNVNDILVYVSATILSTIVIYSIYSWEPLAFLLFTTFLYYYLSEKYSKAYLALGLYTSANPLGFVLIFLILYNTLIREEPKPGKDLIYLLIGLSPYIVLSIVSFQSVLGVFTWFINGFCNNCIYLFIVNDPTSQVIKGLFVIIWVIVITVYLSFKPASKTHIHRYAYIVLYLALAILFNLEPVPQSMIMILPFLPPLYTVYKQFKPIIPHYIVDSMNSLIIVLWFKDIELRKSLSFLGLSIKYDPFTLESPIQWIAQIRNVVLLVILIALINIYLRISRNNG